MGYAAGKLLFTIHEDTGSFINPVGMLFRCHDYDIGKYIEITHYSQLAHRDNVWINHKLFSEKRFTVRTLSMTAYRQYVIFEQLSVFIIFATSHVE